MAFVVDKGCVGCLHKDCIEVCPVECFHIGANMVVIDPEECIDCGVCEPECPEDAISALDDIENETHAKYWAKFNEHYSAAWPRITERDQELPKEKVQLPQFSIDSSKCDPSAEFAPEIN